MSSRRQNRSKTAPIGLGLRTLKGGAVVVAVSVEDDQPVLLLSSFLATATEGDRLSLEPFHMAAGLKRGPGGGASPEALALVTEGRKRQDSLATTHLKSLLSQLQKRGDEAVIAALLINRAGWVTDLLSYGLAFDEHLPVAEGLAVRDALRSAISQCGIGSVELDEKTLPGYAVQTLRLEQADIDTHLQRLGAQAGRPWRKEQKLACLAAWAACAA